MNNVAVTFIDTCAAYMRVSQKVQNKLISVSHLRLSALTLLVDHFLYSTSALFEPYIH